MYVCIYIYCLFIYFFIIRLLMNSLYFLISKTITVLEIKLLKFFQEMLRQQNKISNMMLVYDLIFSCFTLY